MIKDIDLCLSPQEAYEKELLRKRCAAKCGVKAKDVTSAVYLKKSVDSRRKDIKVNARVRVFIDEEEKPVFTPVTFKYVEDAPSVIVVGAGPAGLFAALALLEKGLKPVLIERGKGASERKRDLAVLNREGRLESESNYAFGLGGAGAFSDGKLFTRSVKRGDVSRVLALLVQHGASNEILSDAHPHIGSDKLPSVVENIRNTIEKHGGEVHLSTKVVSLVRNGEKVTGVTCADGRVFRGPVILATGHSASDVYSFLQKDGFTLEAKDVAIGVRLEHPQVLIDRMQYHSMEGRGKYLPSASYKFVTQTSGRGVYSFCMCPGGIVVPAATEEGHLVVNGMSPSARGSFWANSGIVVQLRVSDLDHQDEFAMLRYINEIERKCYNPGFRAPAQRMTDFLEDRLSSSLPRSSYIPGLEMTRMDDVLPSLVAGSLRSGIEDFVRMSRGRFLTDEAVLIAPETRTSSPVRILRNENFCQVDGLYPCGEGAGYAGGIVSAALDGIAVAGRIADGM